MAKLNYVEGDYKEALNIYAQVGLDDVPLTAIPPSRLRVIAEAHATKGEARAFAPAEHFPPSGPQATLLGASRASLCWRFDPGALGWQPTPVTPRKAAASAPSHTVGGALRPSHMLFPQGLVPQLSLRNEGNTFR